MPSVAGRLDLLHAHFLFAADRKRFTRRWHHIKECQSSRHRFRRLCNLKRRCKVLHTVEVLAKLRIQVYEFEDLLRLAELQRAQVETPEAFAEWANAGSTSEPAPTG